MQCLNPRLQEPGPHGPLALHEALCAEDVFQIQPLICGINFSNDTSIHQVRLNKSEIELGSAFETS